MESRLTELAQAFCCKYLSKTQDRENCRVLRFNVGRLTNRNRNRTTHIVTELPPELDGLLGGIGIARFPPNRLLHLA